MRDFEKERRDFKYRLDNDTKKKIADEEERRYKHIEELEKKSAQYERVRMKVRYPKNIHFFTVLAIIIFIPLCKILWSILTFNFILRFFLMIFIILPILFRLSLAFDEIAYSKLEDNFKNKYDEPRNNCCRAIELEKSKLETEKIHIQESAKRRFDEYLKNSLNEEKQYNIQRHKQIVEEQKNKEKQLSIKFAGSNLVTEITAWLTECFCKEIDNADRSEYVQAIRIPFEFIVMQTGIKCQIGIYDFYKHRCPELTDLIEEKALSRAIESKLMIDIMSRYPKDSSGTENSVNVVSSTAYTTVNTVIEYSAENGYYQGQRQW